MTGTAERYRVVAYICEGGVVYEIGDEGVSDFSRVFRNNPDGCRYVVVTVRGEVRAYDLDTSTMLPGYDAQPGKFRVFPSTDAAVIGCSLIDHNTQ